MLKSYWRIAWRHLKKQKTFSLLNIFGLTIGMTCSVLIFLWVQDELSYDRFHAHARDIYRITCKVVDVNAAVTPTPMAGSLKATVPEISDVTRLKSVSGLFATADKKFEEKQVFYADSNFLQVFSYPLVSGDPRKALSRPDGILITQNMAEKYFGTQDAVGKVLHADVDIKARDLVVTGVLKNVPHNSHLRFDMLLPMALYEQTIDYRVSWGNSFDVFTYIRLNEHASAPKLEQRIDALFKAHDDTHAQAAFGLQPLTDIHLHTGQLMLDVSGHGNIQHVRIFSLIALFILGIACINFMNLATALSHQRAKEVGLRKAIGAQRSQLVLQFIGESVLLSLIALVLTMGLSYLFLPLFNNLSHKALGPGLLTTANALFFIGIALLTGVIAGSYPALVLSSFKPVQVLKGVVRIKGVSVRNGLVVLQFTISAALIVSTLVVHTQLAFIRDRSIGFDKENLVYVELAPTGDFLDNTRALEAALAQYPGITNHSILTDLPVYLTRGTVDVSWPGKSPSQQVIVPDMRVDRNFLRTFGVQLKSGRFFSGNAQTDGQYYVVNEAALKMMGIPDAAAAIGKPLEYGGKKGEIIGVVRDFNFKPVRQVIEPLVLKIRSWGNYLVIRAGAGKLPRVMEQVEKVFHQVYPGAPFSYHFLDQDLDNLYTSEQQMGKLFQVFSVLSILVACLGLFGLAAFTAQKRFKEIGIRKVLGASAAGIAVLLSKDFLKLVVLSLVFAFPLAGWIMNRWLQAFAYRIHISWWMYALAGAAAIGIALLTISFQAVKAAVSNPVKSLRTE